MMKPSVIEHLEMQNRCEIYHLSVVDYQDAFYAQKTLQNARIKNMISDTILILQHNPVLTIGKKGADKNILVSKTYLNKKGIQVHNSDRGGDVTFHSPGQVIAYFIIDIRKHEKTIYELVRTLEEIVIRVLKDFKISGERQPGYPGVWVNGEKICAIGLNVTQNISTHGFALNVNNDLEITSYINPCGIVDKHVTSMSNILSNPVDLEKVVFSVKKYSEILLSLESHFSKNTLENVLMEKGLKDAFV